MARGKCPACGHLAGDPPTAIGLSLQMTYPWNLMVRARTHKGNRVFVCDSCNTPLEKTIVRYKASPAASAATRDWTDEVIEFLAEWPTGARGYGGELPVWDDMDQAIHVRDLGDAPTTEDAAAHLKALWRILAGTYGYSLYGGGSRAQRSAGR